MGGITKGTTKTTPKCRQKAYMSIDGDKKPYRTRAERIDSFRKQDALSFLKDGWGYPSIPRKKNPHARRKTWGYSKPPRVKPKGNPVHRVRKPLKAKGTSRIKTP